jgi:hypothetical protein
MRRRALAGAALFWLALAGAAAAEGTDDAVLLRYRFQPGQEFRYRMTVSGDLGTVAGGVTGRTGASGTIPATMSGTYEWVQTVKSVSPQGLATISYRFDRLDLTSASMGATFSLHMGANGKLQVLMNGQSLSPPNADTIIRDPFYECQMDPMGQLTRAKVILPPWVSQLFGGENIASMFNGRMPGMGMLLLPEKSIRTGETWDTKTDIQVPISVPWLTGSQSGGSSTVAHINMSAAIHNRLVRVDTGRAVIETQVTAAAPHGASVALPTEAGRPSEIGLLFAKMTQTTTGTQQLSLEQGEIGNGDYVLRIAQVMTLGLPPGMEAMPLGSPPDTKANATRRSTVRTTPKRTGARPSASMRKPTAVEARSAAATSHAGPASSGLKLTVDGTLKLKLERLPPVEAPPPIPSPPAHLGQK